MPPVTASIWSLSCLQASNLCQAATSQGRCPRGSSAILFQRGRPGLQGFPVAPAYIAEYSGRMSKRKRWCAMRSASSASAGVAARAKTKPR